MKPTVYHGDCSGTGHLDGPRGNRTRCPSPDCLAGFNRATAETLVRYYNFAGDRTFDDLVDLAALRLQQPRAEIERTMLGSAVGALTALHSQGVLR